jgi:16S rRNA (cytosine967-C5)-methyltransferase
LDQLHKGKRQRPERAGILAKSRFGNVASLFQPMPTDKARSELSRKTPSARQSALALLLAIDKAGTIEEGLFDEAARHEEFDTRERSLMVELVRGVLRNRGILDWRLGLVADRPFRKLPIVVQMVLRLGAYQLLFLDRIPESAAVNESVRMVKAQAKRIGRDWSGFVNAVLRSLLRAATPEWPSFESDGVAAWSVRYSCPLWLVDRWYRDWGPESAQQLCRTSIENPPMTLRANLLRTTRPLLLDRLSAGSLDGVPAIISPVGVQLARPRSVSDLPGYSEGWFYVEDEAAQLIPLLLDVQPGQRVLDACAAPGGKSTHLAALMENRGTIVAVDRAGPRMDLVMENCRRLGVSIVTPVTGDIRRLATAQAGTNPLLEDLFDRILLDAPCSGLGVLRRHPEGKWYKAEETIAKHAALQLELLTATYRLLRPGGVLVYSTCSIEPEETEGVIGRFCQDYRDVQRDALAPWLPDAAAPLVTPRGNLSTMNNPYNMDTFYAVRLRRTC